MSVLRAVREWAPFKIDALSIITVLGSDGVRQSVAPLVTSPLVEYLPLMGAQIFADNTISDNLPGFVLYNITDGVMATDLSAWWERWLVSQEFNFNTTTLHIHALHRARPMLSVRSALMLCLNAMIDAALIVLPVLLGDWYGFAATVGLVGTVVARTYVLHSLRDSLDHRVIAAEKRSQDPVLLFLLLPHGKAVTVRTTRGITTEVLLTEARPRHRRCYEFVQLVNWGAFGVLIVSLGSACLCVQLAIIATLLPATFLVVRRFGRDEYHIGRRLKVEQDDPDGPDGRHLAYLRMELNETEETAMVSWHLFPMRSNAEWWDKYRRKQEAMKKPKGQSAAQTQVAPTV